MTMDNAIPESQAHNHGGMECAFFYLLFLLITGKQRAKIGI